MANGGNALEDLLDVGKEPEVEHLVGFVEHDLGRVREIQEALACQVDESTRGTDDDLRAWCARHAPQPLASRTITEPEAMLEDAARTRARGYATTDGELEDGLVSLGLPVRDHQGAIRLALVVSQFASRMSGKAFVGKFLAPTRAVAERISATYADYLRHNA